ncbi:DoxX family protein [Dyadobacter sp. LHD-138]|uniref:DoxX family protein n=1 Tax=Dyadobacter sp. LHD-138 TaxID=3071413 RepID=UPI0027E16169|nr:DoxX family protein [Dyadobacter sp. LHD-138]MDQ6481072.1 DoxX family protein [Dyadobacter sp. LHD-138]
MATLNLSNGSHTADEADLNAQPHWNNAEKTTFRISFIYFFLLAFPLDWKYYNAVFSINWLDLHYRDFFNLAHYSPQFFAENSFLNLIGLLVLAVIGGLLWGAVDKDKKEYHALYYWIRVIVRYRLALGLIAYGLIKFFPLQSPLPSISNLNTQYGDFSDWKIFALTLGVVPGYQSFLGLVEILGGLFLLNRKTTSIGTLIIIPFTGNVFVSNLAYGGGEAVYSFYLILLALFLFAFDAPRFYSLLGLERPTIPNRFHPTYAVKWQQYGRVGLKLFFIFFFVILFGFKTRNGYLNDPYQYPKAPGLLKAAGVYNVAEFKINNKVLLYSPTDPVRWKDVVFENWATLSIRSNKPVIIDSTNIEEIKENDRDRVYEFLGSAGRHYYSYKIDEAQQVLKLENRNKNDAADKFQLHYTRPDSATIVLSGINSDTDSVFVRLEKINKKYLQTEVKKLGRRRSPKL